MKKSDLVKKIHKENPNFNLNEVEVIVDVFFANIRKLLKDGKRIEVRNFGAFSSVKKKSRQGLNPKTGDLIFVPSKKAPGFKMGKGLFEIINS